MPSPEELLHLFALAAMPMAVQAHAETSLAFDAAFIGMDKAEYQHALHFDKVVAKAAYNAAEAMVAEGVKRAAH
jgi:hypothetical protein